MGLLVYFTKSHSTPENKGFQTISSSSKSDNKYNSCSSKAILFSPLKDNKTSVTFLVLQRNDHSLYVRILLFYPINL